MKKVKKKMKKKKKTDENMQSKKSKPDVIRGRPLKDHLEIENILNLQREKPMGHSLKSIFDHLIKESADPHNKYLKDSAKEDLDQLVMILSEYMDSFTIMGYKPNGEEVVIRKSKNTRDKMAMDRIIHGFASGRYELN